MIAGKSGENIVAVEEVGETAEEQTAIDVISSDAEPAPASLRFERNRRRVPIDEKRQLLAAAILDQLAEDGLIAQTEHFLEDKQLQYEDACH